MLCTPVNRNDAIIHNTVITHIKFSGTVSKCYTRGLQGSNFRYIFTIFGTNSVTNRSNVVFFLFFLKNDQVYFSLQLLFKNKLDKFILSYPDMPRVSGYQG